MQHLITTQVKLLNWALSINRNKEHRQLRIVFPQFTTKEENTIIEKVISYTCNKCKKKYLVDDPETVFEFQEFLNIDFVGGYSSVFGDGTSSLRTLIMADNRAQLYIELFEKIHQEKLDNIPKKGEEVALTAVGNHSKGTQFINGSHLISKKLE